MICEYAIIVTWPVIIWRDPARSNCNLNYKDSFYISTVFYNLSGYDSHFIIMEIAIVFEGKIDVLPITKEKYILLTC